MKCLQKLADLEFKSAEIVVGYGQSDLQPSWLEQDLNKVARMCLSERQVSPGAFFIDLPPETPNYLAHFERCARLCQYLRAVTLVVKSSPTGSPYNEEFDRLRNMTRIGKNLGVVVSVLTEQNAISGSLDSLSSLCKGLPSLMVALDPSHFIYGRRTPLSYESIMPRVAHIRLRDTTSKAFQVQVGQGALEYNKLVGLLTKAKYRRALCVDLAPLPDVDQESELRKMRLLVESII